jgi:hypothetical protein
MGRVVVVLGSIMVLWGAGACTSLRESDREWIEARDAPPPSAAARADARDPAVLEREAREQAIALTDDIACDQAVRARELDRDRQGAWALMIACVQRGKWSNLRQFLRLHQPQDTQSEAAMSLLARVIAQRGGEFSADLPSCRDQHWPLYGLADVGGEGVGPQDPWLVFRARVTVAAAPDGDARIVELAEEARGSQDVNGVAVLYHRPSQSIAAIDLGRVGSEDFFTASGVVLRGLLPVREPPPQVGQVYVFLAKFVRGADRGGEDIQRVQIYGSYTPGVAGF